MAHGPPPAKAAGEAAGEAAAPSSGSASRTSLRPAAAAAVHRMARALGVPAAELLLSRGQQLGYTWVELGLDLDVLPSSLFFAPLAYGQPRPTPAEGTRRLVEALHVSLATAAAMMSSDGARVLQQVATLLGTEGGSTGLLLTVLPQVLARLLPMQASGDAAEAEACVRGVSFVRSELQRTRTWAGVLPPRLPLLAKALLLCASSEPAPSPPKRPVSQLLRALAVGAEALDLPAKRTPSKPLGAPR